MKPQNQLPTELYDHIKTNCSEDCIKGLRKLCYWLKEYDKFIIAGHLYEGILYLTLCNLKILKIDFFGNIRDFDGNDINGRTELKALYGIRKKEKLSREWGLN